MKHSTIRFLAVLALAATVGCATRSPETCFNPRARVGRDFRRVSG